jgi:hypothetical protein
MTSKEIAALDYSVNFAMNHATSYASVVRRIASRGNLSIDSLHVMLEDSITPEHYLCVGHASFLLTRIAVLHGLGLNMRDGALVMVEDNVLPIVTIEELAPVVIEDSVLPTTPQKTTGRPRRISLSPLEELLGKFMCHDARRRNNGSLEHLELERLAKLLDEAGEPLTLRLRKRSRLKGRGDRCWKDAVKPDSYVRHDVQKLISRVHKKYSEKYSVQKGKIGACSSTLSVS